MATSYPTSALQPGSTDTAAVRQLQDYLVSSGYLTQAQVNTGYGTYGPQTTQAVLNLQQQLGIDYSSGPGYFGPRTISALSGQQTTTPTQTTSTTQPTQYAGGLPPDSSQNQYNTATGQLNPNYNSTSTGTTQTATSTQATGTVAPNANGSITGPSGTTYGSANFSEREFNSLSEAQKIEYQRITGRTYGTPAVTTIPTPTQLTQTTPTTGTTQYAGGLAPDDPRNQFNTATGQPNPNYNPTAGATGTTAQTQPTAQPGVQAPTVALQPGATGESVKRLQDYLVSLGLMTQAQVNTGYGTYGPQTTAAVLELQRRLGIDYSSGPGYFGPRTIAAIQAAGGQIGGTQPQPGQPQGTSPYANGLLPDDPSNQYNTQTGQPNPNYNGGQPGTGGFGEPGGFGGGTPQQPPGPYDDLDPVERQVRIYQDAYRAIGVADVKTQLQKVIDDQQELSDELQDKILGVNNNPWLSEGIRVKQIEKLQESYRTRFETLSNLESLYDSIYRQGLSQVDSIVGNVNADIAAAGKIAQQQMEAAQALAADNQIIESDGRNLLVNKTTGRVVADLGAASVSSSSSSGAFNLSAGQTRYDAQGNVIASVPRATSTSTALPRGTVTSGSLQYSPAMLSSDSSRLETSRGPDGYVDSTLYNNLYKAWTQAGGTASGFVSTFPPKNYVNPADTWLPPVLWPPGASTRSI